MKGRCKMRKLRKKIKRLDEKRKSTDGAGWGGG